MQSDGGYADSTRSPALRAGRRAQHSNSHGGCSQCKARHVKCDEGKPICRRCCKRNQPCDISQKHGPPKIESDFKSFVFHPNLRTALVLSEDELRHLTFFEASILPALLQSAPSSLWLFLKQQLRAHATLCYAAISLASQQESSISRRGASAIEASQMHLNAISVLRRSMAQQQHDHLIVQLCACLLITISQISRAESDEFHIHLRYGVSIALAQKTDNVMLQECLSLLRQYMLTTALYLSLSRRVHPFMDLVAHLPTQQSMPPTLDQTHLLLADVNSLALDLLALSIAVRGTQAVSSQQDSTHDHLAPSEVARRATELKARYDVLNKLIDEARSSDLGSPFLKAQTGLARAACCLTGIFMRCMSTDNQSSYDLELEAFLALLDMISTSQWDIQNLSAQDQHALHFSPGFGLICMLTFTALLCRHAETRRRAVEMLAFCPPRDGLWEVHTSQSICQAIIAHEEQFMPERTSSLDAATIPEQVRVHYFEILPPVFTGIDRVLDGGAAASPILRLFFRGNRTDSSFESRDIVLRHLTTMGAQAEARMTDSG